jgi:predicted transporter
MVAAIAIGGLAFALGPFFDAVGLYFLHAGVLLPVIGRVIPSKMAYWMTPDGGPAAGVFLILVCALLFWTVVFGVSYFARAKMRRKRSVQRTYKA